MHMKNNSQQFDYLRLFGIKDRNSINELSIAEVKGLKSLQITTLCKTTGLSLDHIATVLNISRKQINYKMIKGGISAKEADILLNVAKIISEYFRLYPDIQDFWLLFLAGREELNGKSALFLSRTEIGRGRVLEMICKERDEYLLRYSEGITVQKTPKTERKSKMAGIRASKSYKVVSDRKIDSEKVLNEIQKKRAKQMKKNKRVSRDAMQRKVR
jgi:predicted XRE-type DNA-binding protein